MDTDARTEVPSNVPATWPCCLHQVLAWRPVCLRQSPSCVTHFAQRVLSTWESQVGTQPELLSTASGNPGRPGPGLSPPPRFPFPMANSPPEVLCEPTGWIVSP
ncbi:hypothetical protein V8C43DRAFT_289622, partial [Trichoderma afarasin]